MLNVAAVGYLSDIKGLQVVKQLINLNHHNYYVFGKAEEQLPCYVHGEYDGINELRKLFQRFNINVALLLSLCYESYSFTLTECLQCNIPVIGSDRGAIGSRLNTYKNCGFVVEPDNVDKINGILSMLDNDRSLLVCNSPNFMPVDELQSIYNDIVEGLIYNV